MKKWKKLAVDTRSAQASDDLLSSVTGTNGMRSEPRSPSSPSSDAGKGPPKASATAVTMNLITAALGCGILSMPWATAGSSIITGAVLTFFVLILNGCTIMILVVAADRAKIYDLGGLFKKIPRYWGRPARVFCDVTIWLCCFLCLVGNLIVASDSLQPLLKFVPLVSHQGHFASVILVFIAALPLCCLDQRHLAFSSAAAIVANIYALGLILVIYVDGGTAENCCLLNWGPGAVSMISVLMQAVSVQMCVLPMYEVLERRSPMRFLGCLVVGFGFVFLLFVAFSTGAYLAYGPHVSSNVLNNLPDTFAGNLARIGMGVTALAVYPIMLISMIAPIQHSEQRARKKNEPFVVPSPRWEVNTGMNTPASPSSPRNFSDVSPEKLENKFSDLSSPLLRLREDPLSTLSPSLLTTRDLARLSPGDDPFGEISPSISDDAILGQAEEGQRFWRFVAKLPAKPSTLVTVLVLPLTCLGAVWCPSLGMVNIYSGSMTVAGLVALAPGLMGIYFMGRQSILWFLCMIALVLFGVIATVLELRYTDRDMEQVMKHCTWPVRP